MRFCVCCLSSSGCKVKPHATKMLRSAPSASSGNTNAITFVDYFKMNMFGYSQVVFLCSIVRNIDLWLDGRRSLIMLKPLK